MQFGWPLGSDIAAVTKARREIRLNLLGYPKFPNQSQPLVAEVRHIMRICGGDIAV